MFSNLAAVSLSSFYHCVIVITYSSSSFNFELLSLLFFIPDSLSHVHLGSSCFFSLLNVHSSSVLSECRGECSCSMYRWIELAHGPQTSELSESVTLHWLKLPHPAKAASTATQNCEDQKFLQSMCKWQHSKFSNLDSFRYICVKLDKAHFRNMS